LAGLAAATIVATVLGQSAAAAGVAPKDIFAVTEAA